MEVLSRPSHLDLQHDDYKSNLMTRPRNSVITVQDSSAQIALIRARSRQHHLSETSAAVDIKDDFSTHNESRFQSLACSFPDLLNEDGYVRTGDFPIYRQHCEQHGRTKGPESTTVASLHNSGSQSSTSDEEEYLLETDKIGLSKPPSIKSDDFCTRVQSLVSEVESSDLTYEDFFMKVKYLVNLVDDYTDINDSKYHKYDCVANRSEEDTYIEIIVHGTDPEVSTDSREDNESDNSDEERHRTSSLPDLHSQKKPRPVLRHSSDSKSNLDADGYTIVRPAKSDFNIISGFSEPPLPPPRRKKLPPVGSSGSQEIARKVPPDVPPKCLPKRIPRYKQSVESMNPSVDPLGTYTSAELLSSRSPAWLPSDGHPNESKPNYMSQMSMPAKIEPTSPDELYHDGDVLSGSFTEDDFVNIKEVLQQHQKMKQGHNDAPSYLKAEPLKKKFPSSEVLNDNSPQIVSPAESRTLPPKSSSATSSQTSFHRSMSMSGLCDEDRYSLPPDAVVGYVEPLYSIPHHTYYKFLKLGNVYQNPQSFAYRGWLSIANKGKGKKITWRRKQYCCLETAELRIYGTKENTNLHMKPHKVLIFEKWCHLVKLGDCEFKLTLKEESFHLKADNKLECSNWITILSQVMKCTQLPENSTGNIPSIQDFLTVSINRSTYKCLAVLEHGHLQLYSNSEKEKLLYSLNMEEYTVEIKSPSHPSESLVSSICLKGEMDTVQLLPSQAEECQKWYYYLCAISKSEYVNCTPFEQSLKRLSNPSRLISASEPESPSGGMIPDVGVDLPLTTLPTSELISMARDMFKQIQVYATTTVEHARQQELWYFIVFLQSLFTKCMAHHELQGEFYCQLISLISRQTSLNMLEVLQGWQLMAIAIPLFLPTSPKLMWYIERCVQKHLNSSNNEIRAFASCCQKRLLRAQKNKGRMRKPSGVELQSQLSQFPNPPTKPISMEVKISTGDVVVVSFDPSSTVQELISYINQELGLPPSSATQFSLSCDWPGLEDASEIYLHPLEKICDVISQWYNSLCRQCPPPTRQIQLGYRKRAFFSSRYGMESEKEALLLVHQINQYIVNTQYKLSMEMAMECAALMLQIVNGPYSEQVQASAAVEESLRNYMPIRYVMDMLPTDESRTKDQISFLWQQLHSLTKADCLNHYLSKVRNIPLFGYIQFPAEHEGATEVPLPVIIAVGEGGIKILTTSLSEVRHCAYKHIESFGRSGESFMLFLNNQETNICEKMVFNLPQVLMQELALLVSTYIEVHLGNNRKTKPDPKLRRIAYI